MVTNLDLLPELDATARPRPKPPVKVRAKRGISRRRAEPIPVPGTEVSSSQTQIPDEVLALDIQDTLAAITNGENSHQALVSLAGKFAAQGLPETTAVDLLTYAADQRPVAGRDAGWQKMRADIARTVSWAFEQEAQSIGAPRTSAASALMTIPLPVSGNGATPPPPPPPPGGSAGPQWTPGAGPGSGSVRLLVLNKNPKIAGNVANVITHLLQHPELVGCAAYDQMARDVVLCQALPDTPALATPRPWTDAETSELQDFLQRTCQMGRVGQETVRQGVEAVARKRPFHPVRDYLHGLTWDGTPRLSSWLADYLGVEASEYATATGRMWLIGLVARIEQPGCKLDYIIVLEGLQGTFKSEVCNALCGPWTSDQVLDIRSDSRAVSQHLRNVWLVELSELTLFKRPEGVELLKAFLSRRQEKYLARYAAKEVIEPRQCGFVGTTNQSDYLHDPTGNRRIWPHLTGTIQLRRLMRDRDQLWAEAVTAYRAHERYWPTPAFEARVIEPQQRERYYVDAWQEPIETELARLQVAAAKARAAGKPDERARTTLLQIWQAAMTEPGMAASSDATRLRFDRSAQIRVRDTLRFLGWERGKQTRLARWWVEPL
jgi:predicted P-loop ATPase